MLIDQTHRNWFIGSAIGLGAAVAIYIPYSVHSSQGPRGGSALGLVYGSVGFVFMLFAGLLGLVRGGGNPARSNALMRWRVILQAAALLLFALLMTLLKS